MDHTEAVRLQAAEKYLLGELPKEQHAAYEEHYFDCSICAEEIKATAAFMEGTRQVAREEVPQAIEDKTLVPVAPRARGWFDWLLRPAFAVPVFAALLVFVTYQNSVTIPGLKEAPPSPSAQIVRAPIHLTGSVRGGNEVGDVVNKVLSHSGESFLLRFDFTPARAFSTYQWQLLDQEGRLVRKGVLGSDFANQEVFLPVMGGVERSGKYNLVFSGGANSNSQATNESEVQRLTFTVEFPK